MNKQILIYNDLGCENTDTVLEQFKLCLNPFDINVNFVNADEIINHNALNQNIIAFIIPGGASSPYKEKLGEKGNKIIEQYVKDGGCYIGICAGAYYPCQEIIFEQGIPELEKVAKHGLNLIDAKAIGTLHKELNISPYSFDFDSVALPQIKWHNEPNNIYNIYYHGGPYFILNNDDNNHTILARYDNIKNTPPAVIYRKYGKGKVIVSGVHFEFGFHHIASNIKKENNPPKIAFELLELAIKSEENRKDLMNKIINLILD